MTRDELTTAVLERLGVGSSRTAFLTQIHGHLNRNYVREVMALGLLMEETTVVFTADDQTVNLPADFGAVETFRIGEYILTPKTLRGMLANDAAVALSGNPETGPRYYEYFPPDRLRVGPAPVTSETTGSLVYRARPALMTVGTDEPDVIPEHFHDLLVEMAVYRMAMNQEEQGMSQDALAHAAIIRDEIRTWKGEVAGSSTDRVIRRHYG